MTKLATDKKENKRYSFIREMALHMLDSEVLGSEDLAGGKMAVKCFMHALCL